VPEQQRRGDGADAAWYRAKGAGDLSDFRVDVAGQPAVGRDVGADVDHRGARGNMIRTDQSGSARGHHQHIGLNGHGGQLPGTGMADGDGRVPVKQQVRQGLADHRRTADHHRTPPGQRDPMVFEQPDHRLGGSGRERGQAGHDAAERGRVRAVDVLV